MNTWNPGPTSTPSRVDRPAVAIVLTLALFFGALLGLYAAHVLTPHRDGVASTSRAPFVEPRCRTYTRGNIYGTDRRAVPSIRPCSRTYSRGTV